jgi:hypothetical protein
MIDQPLMPKNRTPERRRGVRFVLTLALVCATISTGTARESGPPAALFAAEQPLELTLTLPLRTLIARRERRPDIDGVLTYTEADGRAVSLDVEVTTRGHNRLATCSFPPLRLDLKRRQLDGTVFDGQNRLKLVTQCRSSSQYQQYLELEYLIYKLYEQVAPLGFRVRRAAMQYVATDGRNRTQTAPAFFVEPIDGVAERAGLEVVERPAVRITELDARQAAMVSVMQYVIGGTDWSMLASAPGDDCCHNVSLLGPETGDGGLIPVPYDFDQTGLVDAAYAQPSRELPIRSVRERLYRGFCSANAHVAEAAGLFVAARPAIEALFENAPLDDRYREKALRYLAEAFEILADPQRRQQELEGRCRPD